MVSIPGGDYATARPIVASMQQAGWKFVCRYLRDLVKSNGDKSLSLAEAVSLWAYGIDVVSNEETTGTQGLTGYDGGVRDARAADDAHRACGGPPTRPIYFSPWDHDPALLTSSQWTAMAGYLRGCAAALNGIQRVGLYGGRAMLTWAFDNRLCTYGWQAAGWTHGGIEPRAHIIQHVGSPIPGTDTDTAIRPDYGQWYWKPPASQGKDHATMLLVKPVGGAPVYVDMGTHLVHIGTEELRAYADIWGVDEATARAAIVEVPADAGLWELPAYG